MKLSPLTRTKQSCAALTPRSSVLLYRPQKRRAIYKSKTRSARPFATTWPTPSLWCPEAAMSKVRKESTPTGDPYAEPLNISTKLAFDRTRLPHHRTMLAWVRTATSLITFGFSFYKFFTFEAKGAAPMGWIGPREFALTMIGIGL